MKNDNILFRQPIYGDEGKFSHWHYWGPSRFTYNLNACSDSDSQIWIGAWDIGNKPVFEGDILKDVCGYRKERLYLVVHEVRDIVSGFRLKEIEHASRDGYYADQSVGSPCRWKHFEIVGNEIENPELLK